ncbi:MAG TPA: YlxR family protein [Ktedonobacterales bacterium]
MATTPKQRKAPKQRHIPQRTCIACREVRPKRELIRVVRTPAGHVELDATGKKSGRGAYICAKRSCWEPALRKGRIEHELETTLLPEDRAALEAYVATLPAETAAPSSAPSAHLSTKGKKAPPPATAPAATTDGSQSGT